ncbi:MAG: peptidylprolyl isomerase [Candidatus Nezhaarchaeota archaeon]|nr:peptidylprolyl isomerase [Candidatus Nezhaarchaeota archaeon]
MLSLPIQKGDYVLIDYVASVKESGEIIDLTREDVAKAKKFYREDGLYEPQLVIVGEGWVPKGVDEALVGMEEGEEKVVEVPPEKAFGLRDPEKVKIFPARELTKRGIVPRVGARVEVDGKVGIVRSVGGGRVTLDFNHPLAGCSIVYELKVVSKVEGGMEKAKELLHRRMRRVPKEKLKVKLEGDVLEVELPEEAFTLEDVQFAKRGFALDVGRYLPSISTIRFYETYVIKKGASPASPSQG